MVYRKRKQPIQITENIQPDTKKKETSKIRKNTRTEEKKEKAQ